MPERDYGLADIVQRSGTARAGLLRDLGQAEAQNRLALGAAQAQGYQDQGQRSALLAGSLAKIVGGAVDDYQTGQKIKIAQQAEARKSAQEEAAAARDQARTVTAQQDLALKQHEANLKDQASATELLVNMGESVKKNPDLWPHALKAAEAIAPGISKQYDLTQEFDPAKLDLVIKAGTDHKDQIEQEKLVVEQRKLLDAEQGPTAINDQLKNMAGYVMLGKTPEDRAARAQVIQGWKLSEQHQPAFNEALARFNASDKTPEALRALALTPEQNVQAEQNAATGARLDASAIETKRHNQVMEARPVAGATAAAGLDDAGLDLAAATYRITRSLPSRNAAQTGPIISRAAAQAKALGQTPANVIQRQYATKADSAALDQSVKIATAVEGFEAKALPQADLVDSLSKKVGRTASPLLNKALLAGKADVIGDADTRLLYNAITTFTSEYAKIIEGSTGSVGASSDLARRKSEEMVRSIDSPATVTKLLNQMKYEMSLTRQGWDATIGHINERLGGGSTGEKPPVGGKGDPLGIR